MNWVKRRTETLSSRNHRLSRLHRRLIQITRQLTLKSMNPFLSRSNVRKTWSQNSSALPLGKNILYMSTNLAGVNLPLGQSCCNVKHKQSVQSLSTGSQLADRYNRTTTATTTTTTAAATAAAAAELIELNGAARCKCCLFVSGESLSAQIQSASS